MGEQHEHVLVDAGFGESPGGREGALFRGMSSAGIGAAALRTRFAQLVLAATEDETGTAKLLGLKKPSSIRRYAPKADRPPVRS